MILPPNRHHSNSNQADSKSNEMGREDSSARLFFSESLMYNNRLTVLIHLMKCHPSYVDAFCRVHNFILRGDGPLSYSYRHYIAIMAAARHRCSFLVNMQKQEFLAFAGEEKDWLKGLEYAPKKLQDLSEINKILAHQPWLLSKHHIEKLTKGGDSWSLSELVHGILILAHFHSLSTFVFALGINDVDLDDQTLSRNGHIGTAENVSPPPSPPCKPSSNDAEGGVEVLMKKMQTISRQKMLEDGSKEEDALKQFETIESQSVDLGLINSEQSELSVADSLKYIIEANFTYVDFARRKESCDVTTFRIQDYSWDDHAFSLVNRLYNDVGSLLDDKFKITYTMTYNTMGRKRDVDTTMFRRAIWHYLQCLYGIRQDDYDYREVNELLSRSLKSYIKTACCFPHRLRKNDSESILADFRRSEQIHISLMICEARMQAELLYALRAVMRYMT